LRNIEAQTATVQKYLADNQGKEVDIDAAITPGDIHSAQYVFLVKCSIMLLTLQMVFL